MIEQQSVNTNPGFSLLTDIVNKFSKESLDPGDTNSILQNLQQLFKGPFFNLDAMRSFIFVLKCSIVHTRDDRK